MKKKIFLATPLGGYTAPEYLSSLIGVFRAGWQPHQIALHPGGCCLFIARNELTAEFLRSDCTHLLFVDSDLEFAVDHVKRITCHDEAIVGGVYPLKDDRELRLACVPLPDQKARCDGLQAVQRIGTGFLLIERRVFDKLIEAEGERIAYLHPMTRSRTWDFWRGEVREQNGLRVYLPEDYNFCERVRALGFKVFADTKVFLRHNGLACYPMAHQLPEAAPCN